MSLGSPLRWLLLPLCTLTSSDARDLLPDRWFEDISGTDDSLQRCLVFRTVAGVAYQVEVSNNLFDWETESEVYGMGQEFVVPMREIAPPPVAQNPPVPISPPKLAFLRMQPSSGSGGGTVFTWRSLDNGEPMSFVLDADMNGHWGALTYFVERYGDFQFCLWHPPGPVTPPQEVPLPGPLDAAMLAVLEDHFDDMNLAAENSAWRARNSPPPAPPAPDSRRFWRIRADWSVDTDHDNTPDWAEFELALDTSHPNQPLGDPFNPDADGNGINDGQETDLDKDGIPNEVDASQNDGTVDWERGPVPKYALFQIQGAPPPSTPEGWAIHVTDQGQILFPGGVWTEGIYKPLKNQTAAIGGAKALGMDSKGRIVGYANYDYDDNGVPEREVMVYWSSADALPSVIEKSGGDSHTFADPGIHRTSQPGADLIDAEGNFFATEFSLEWGEPNPGSEIPKPYSTSFAKWSRWVLPDEPGQPPDNFPAAAHAERLIDKTTFWGPDPANDYKMLFTNGSTSVPSHGNHRKVVKTPGEGYLATGNWLTPSESLIDGEWKPSADLKDALDMSSQGWAIMGDAKLWANGFSLPLAAAAPGIPASWRSLVDLHDISPIGNILLSHDDNSGTGRIGAYALALPFHLEDVEIETGVDSVSVTVENPGPGVANKHWIMAPAGGENTVFVRSPACATCPLKLVAPGIGIEPQIISQDQAQITVSAPAGATTADHDLTIGLGGRTSSTFPIGVKVMKKRDVRVIVHKIASLTKDPNGNDVRITPDLPLSREQIQESLNKTYSPQINTTFTVEMNPPGEGEYVDIAWDIGKPSDYEGPESNLFAPHDQRLQMIGGDVLSVEAKEIDSALKSDSHHINIYMIGCKIISVMEINGNLYHGSSAFGIGYTDPLNVVFINANAWAPDRAAEMKNTLAHEIGHLFFGPGHPDQGDGVAPLKGTNHQDRLMVSGKRTRRPNFGYLTVKGEWDEAEEWLKDNVHDE